MLPNLNVPSLIIMDNAAYHKTKPPGTPIPAKTRKGEAIAFLTSKGVSVDPAMSAWAVKQELRKFIAKNVKSEVEQLAEAAGHRVIWTPPHFSDLQPTELAWAEIKENIGRRYTKDTTLAQVKERLDNEFARLETFEGKVVIRKIINSVDKHVEYHWQKVKREEEMLDAEDIEEDEEIEPINGAGGADEGSREGADDDMESSDDSAEEIAVV